MPGADDCAIAFRQGMLDVLKLDTLPPAWEPMAKERVVQAIAEDPELAHDIMYAGPDVTKARGLAGKPLAGFCTTPSRRITVVYGVIVYAIRFKNPSLHR